MSQDPNINSRLSVRRKLPGMTAVSKSTATGITPSAGVRKMLRNASANNGFVKIQIKNQVLVGKTVGSKNLVDRKWSEKFDGLRKYLDESEPCYIACWRNAKDCLLVTFIPETTAPRGKMLYAGTTEALKVSIGEIDEKGSIEEYNIREAEELSFEAYEARKNTPLAYTDFELEKMEIEQQEKQEMEERTKQMKERKGKNAPPVALLGLSVAAAVVAQGKAGGGRLNVKEAVKAANQSKVKPSKKAAKVVEKMTRGEEEEKEVNEKEEDEKQTEEELEEEVKKEMSELQEIAKEEEEDAEKEEEAEEAKKQKEEEEAAAAAAAAKKKEEEAAAKKKEEEMAAAAAAAAAKKKEAEAAAKEKEKEKEKEEEKKEEKKEEKSTVVPPIGATVSKQKDKIKNSFKFFKDKVQKGAGAVKPQKKKGMSDEDLAKYPADDGQHTLSELQEMVKTKEYGDVDKNTIEMCLSSREFVQVFNVEKEEFKNMPGWKQKRLKTEKKLF